MSREMDLLRKVGGKIPASEPRAGDRPRAAESPGKEAADEDDFWNMRESGAAEKVNLGDMSTLPAFRARLEPVDKLDGKEAGGVYEERKQGSVD